MTRLRRWHDKALIMRTKILVLTYQTPTENLCGFSGMLQIPKMLHTRAILKLQISNFNIIIAIYAISMKESASPQKAAAGPQSAEGHDAHELGSNVAKAPTFSVTAGPLQPKAEAGSLLSNQSAQPAAQLKTAGAAPIQRATKMRDDYPWEGVVHGAWSAALRSSAQKDAKDPHKNTIADVPKGAKVTVTGKTGDWYAVTWGSKKGYIHTTLVDDLVTRKIQDDFVGKEMIWKASGGNGTTDFAKAARDDSKDAKTGEYNSKMPTVAPKSVMNCWEMVLLAAYQTGMLSREKVAKWYNDGDLNAKMMASKRSTYEMGNPKTPRPDRGDIVYMNGINHVVIAQGKQVGGKEAVFSFWSPSDYSVAQVKAAQASGNIDSVTKGKVQDTTIEKLADWMKGMGMSADPITFGHPGW
jgi:hypothetical protein